MVETISTAPPARHETDPHPEAGGALRAAAASTPLTRREDERRPPPSIEPRAAHWLPLAVPLMAVMLLMSALLVLSDI